MEEQLINFETAVMAKKLGFDYKCHYFYYDDKTLGRGMYNDKIGDFLFCNWNESSLPLKTFGSVISAPPQSLLQKWLREKYKIFLTIKNDKKYDFHGWDMVNIIVFDDDNDTCEHIREIGAQPYRFETWEEALEKGLYAALGLAKYYMSDESK